jgi:hypothetical protein
MPGLTSRRMRPTAAMGVSVDVVMEDDWTIMVMNMPITRACQPSLFGLA